MKQFGWIFSGLIAAAVGAGIWAAISYYAHFELGWIAWIIGGMVGIAVAATAQEHAGMMTGVGAAAIALAGILGGKYISIRMEVNSYVAEAGYAEVTDALVISWIADSIAQERMDAGETLEWPTEFELGEAIEESEYPVDIWAEASGQWESGDEAWRAQYREFVEYETEKNLAAFADEVSGDVLFENLDLFDLIFFLLAVITAWKIGSGDGD